MKQKIRYNKDVYFSYSENIFNLLEIELSRWAMQKPPPKLEVNRHNSSMETLLTILNSEAFKVGHNNTNTEKCLKYHSVINASKVLIHVPSIVHEDKAFSLELKHSMKYKTAVVRFSCNSKHKSIFNPKLARDQ